MIMSKEEALLAALEAMPPGSTCSRAYVEELLRQLSDRGYALFSKKVVTRSTEQRIF